MARRISASVGRMGGVNRPPDVKTVQELLNQVPPTSGGPKPPLVVDRICGPKTIKAIQTFQLHHFGWKGADGRVDPNGPTLAKLNEFDPPQGRQRRLLSIRCVLEPGRFLDPRPPQHWFFEIREVGKAHRATYHLGKPLEHKRVHVPRVFLGDVVTFRCSRPPTGLATRGAGYRTIYDIGIGDKDGPGAKAHPLFGELTLALLVQSSGHPTSVEHLKIVYTADIEPPLKHDPSWDELLGRAPPVMYRRTGVATIRVKHGRFNLVRSSPG